MTGDGDDSSTQRLRAYLTTEWDRRTRYGKIFYPIWILFIPVITICALILLSLVVILEGIWTRTAQPAYRKWRSFRPAVYDDP